MNSNYSTAKGHKESSSGVLSTTSPRPSPPLRGGEGDGIVNFTVQRLKTRISFAEISLRCLCFLLFILSCGAGAQPVIRTVAGTGSKGIEGDGGPGVSAQVNDPGGICRGAGRLAVYLRHGEWAYPAIEARWQSCHVGRCEWGIEAEGTLRGAPRLGRKSFLG